MTVPWTWGRWSFFRACVSRARKKVSTRRKQRQTYRAVQVRKSAKSAAVPSETSRILKTSVFTGVHGYGVQRERASFMSVDPLFWAMLCPWVLEQHLAHCRH